MPLEVENSVCSGEQDLSNVGTQVPISTSFFEDSLAHTAIIINEMPIKETSGKTRNGQEVLSIDRSAGLLSLTVVQCSCVSTKGCQTL